MRALALPLLALVGCNTPAGRDLALEPPSADDYPAVQPILEARCGTLDCHGDPGRPLVLHGPTGLRLEGRAPLCAPARDVPCDPAPACGAAAPCVTRDELAADVLSFAAVDEGSRSVDERLALLKPLDDVGGGVDHVGGAIWESRDAPGYVCLRSWLAGAIDEIACRTACDADCDCQVARACGEESLPACLVELGIAFEDPACP